MILDSEHEQDVTAVLSLLAEPVVLSIHTNQWDSPATQAIRDLVHYTVSLMPQKISREVVGRIGADLDPAVTIRNRDGKVFGVHFVGTPTGLEYRSFIEAVVASVRPQDSSPTPWSQLLKEIHHPVSANIFVSPT